MKIAVFCSANNNIDPTYFNMAERLGKWIGEHGHTLIYGGGNSGLMECIGKSVHEQAEEPLVSSRVSWKRGAE